MFRLFALLGFAGLLCSSNSFSQVLIGEEIFGDQQEISRSFGNPVAQYTLDVDEDGALDVVSLREGDRTLAWHRRIGPAVWTETVISNEIFDAQDMRIGDVDADGDEDILVYCGNDPDQILSLNDRRFLLFRNLGLGQFADAEVVMNIDNVLEFELVYVNADSFIDLVYTLGSDGSSGIMGLSTTYWASSDGLGGFVNPIEIFTGLDNPIEMHWTDIGSDGDMDLMVHSSADEQVALLVNQGIFGFGVPSGLLNFGEFHHFETAQLNDNSHVDLVYVNSATNTLNYREGTDTEVFLFEIQIDVLDAEVLDMALGDMNGDGKVDIVVATEQTNTFQWYENITSGDWISFAAPQSLNLIGLDLPASSTTEPVRLDMLLDDINDDGVNDIMYGTNTDDMLLAILNNGAMTSFEFVNITFSTTREVGQVEVLELDDDDLPDLVFQRRGPAMGYMPSPASTPFVQNVPGVLFEYSLIEVSDLDMNDTDEVLAVNGNRIDFFTVSGGALIPTPAAITIPFGEIVAMEVGDMDNDGDPDILIARTFNTLYALDFIENTGSGDFNAPYELDFFSGHPEQLELVDIDGDGLLDVFVRQAFSSTVYGMFIQRGEGDAALDVQMPLNTIVSGAREVSFVDIDADGDLDMLGARLPFGIGTSPASVYSENDGTGYLGTIGDGQQHVIISSFDPLVSRMADMDGDGDLDLVLGTADRITYYRNDANSFVFAEVVTHAVNMVSEILLIDLNGNGRSDIISASSVDGLVAWYENIGLGCPEDITGDGVVDINDFIMLNSAFGMECFCPEDLTGDGVVNINDFIMLNTAFGNVCD